MLVLGPDITLAKVRNVTGLTVDIQGDVQKMEGDPQVMLQSLINQFVELSGMIVKKTMESILTSYPGMAAMAASNVFGTPAVAKSAPQGIDVTAQTTSAPSQQTVTALPTVGPALQTPVTPKPEPPALTDIKLDSLTNSKKPDEQPAQAATFSNQDMNKLNQALDDLSKAPLSTESPAKTV